MIVKGLCLLLKEIMCLQSQGILRSQERSPGALDITVPGHSENKLSGRRHPLFHLAKIKIAQYPLFLKAKEYAILFYKSLD